MMRTYPKTTSNKNVPADSFLIADVSTMSGEIVTTYYSDRDGNLWSVIDWHKSKPYPVHLFEVCRLTGDTENMIRTRIESHFRLNPVKAS